MKGVPFLHRDAPFVPPRRPFLLALAGTYLLMKTLVGCDLNQPIASCCLLLRPLVDVLRAFQPPHKTFRSSNVHKQLGTYS